MESEEDGEALYKKALTYEDFGDFVLAVKYYKLAEKKGFFEISPA